MKGERRTVTAVRLPTMPTLHTRGSSVSLEETRSPANTNYLAIMKRYEASKPQLVREDVNLKNGDICHNLLDRFGTVFVTI